MDEQSMIEQEEQELYAQDDPGTLLSDTVHCIRMERDRIEERTGTRYNSSYERYSVLMKALEDKSAAEKELKDAVKHLWEGVESENEDVILAFLGEIERVARESAMAWMHIAAIAEKAKAEQEKLREKLKAAEEKLAAEKEAAEKRAAEDAGPYKARTEAAEAEVAALKKQLAMSDEATVIFKLRFKEWQEAFRAAMAALARLPEGAKEKCRGAILAQLDNWKEAV